MWIQRMWKESMDQNGVECMRMGAIHPKSINIGLAEVRRTRCGELGVLRVREHPLGAQVHPLIAKCTLSK